MDMIVRMGGEVGSRSSFDIINNDGLRTGNINCAEVQFFVSSTVVLQRTLGRNVSWIYIIKSDGVFTSSSSGNGKTVPKVHRVSIALEPFGLKRPATILMPGFNA